MFIFICLPQRLLSFLAKENAVANLDGQAVLHLNISPEKALTGRKRNSKL